MLKADFAVAKVAKYAVSESGDSVEIVERPQGGLSAVMADGQRSGRSAKAISIMAVHKAASLLAEGVRDGAAARAAHDYLRTERRGQVSAELIIISIDLETRTLVISRNSHCPVLLFENLTWRLVDAPSTVVGIYARSRPVIEELPMAAGQVVVAFTDGLIAAGQRRGITLDPLREVQSFGCPPACTAQEIADSLLARAVELDQGRPTDDTSVVAVRISENPDPAGPEVRRMSVSFPVGGG